MNLSLLHWKGLFSAILRAYARPLFSGERKRVAVTWTGLRESDRPIDRGEALRNVEIRLAYLRCTMQCTRGTAPVFIAAAAGLEEFLPRRGTATSPRTFTHTAWRTALAMLALAFPCSPLPAELRRCELRAATGRARALTLRDRRKQCQGLARDCQLRSACRIVADFLPLRTTTVTLRSRATRCLHGDALRENRLRSITFWSIYVPRRLIFLYKACRDVQSSLQSIFRPTRLIWSRFLGEFITRLHLYNFLIEKILVT